MHVNDVRVLALDVLTKSRDSIPEAVNTPTANQARIYVKRLTRVLESGDLPFGLFRKIDHPR